eukprot:4937082-Prymnesium_polylepis.1
MHGCLSEFNVLLDESMQQHLLVDSSDKVVQATIASATEEINNLWGGVHMQKRLYWGKDADLKAQPAPAVNGPDMKVIITHPTLLPKSCEIMAQVWDLLESKDIKTSEAKK